ncbi:hypothetical protein E4U54_005015 [Claviceps lovelessii]|nr:hypothetical protein E4U54_005015 [Claviceps lovelessii]
MLRRPATTLQITPEDMAAYEDRRAAEARAAEAEAQGVRAQHQQRMEGVQHESPGAARSAREERIGVGRRR